MFNKTYAYTEPGRMKDRGEGCYSDDIALVKARNLSEAMLKFSEFYDNVNVKNVTEVNLGIKVMVLTDY